jgi:uncharacterized protein YbbC (DUF1343 family)
MNQRKIIAGIISLLIFLPGISRGQWFDDESEIVVGAERISQYLPFIRGKSVGVVANHTSVVGSQHLIDTLLSLNIRIKKIYSPEHGFRGETENGALINNSRDPLTKLPIISLYGSNKKPSPEQMVGINVMIFDLQDVGVRFFTYISTLHYVMEACAESGIPLVVLDRPNPNGDYIAGPVINMRYSTFVGLDPIPVVYGLTVGELAKMINGESWLKTETGERLFCRLEVIKCNGYSHSTEYDPPVNPSPNLPNYQAIRLYPSICLFEGTAFSVGRGTQYPFQIYGHPDFVGPYSFTPEPIPGKSTIPKHYKKECHGIDLRNIAPPKFTLKYIAEAYSDFKSADHFFNSYFKKLIGNGNTESMIKAGKNYREIEETWKNQLFEFNEKRKKYFLYPE